MMMIMMRSDNYDDVCTEYRLGETRRAHCRAAAPPPPQTRRAHDFSCESVARGRQLFRTGPATARTHAQKHTRTHAPPHRRSRTAARGGGRGSGGGGRGGGPGTWFDDGARVGPQGSAGVRRADAGQTDGRKRADRSRMSPPPPPAPQRRARRRSAHTTGVRAHTRIATIILHTTRSERTVARR